MTSHPSPSTDVGFARWVHNDRAFCFGVGIVTVLLATLYMGHMLDRGWIPHDEGLLAQSAERILNGQIPHRDFDEVYTGGLSYLNALAFRIWGANLMSMRLMLLVFFVVWVPLFYYCTTRILTTVSAGIVTLAAVAWGPPNYPAAIPSWYNLFLATAMIAAIFRFIEDRSLAWLFIAGLCGGTSFLFKSVGLYSIGGVLLFLLFYERSEQEAPASRARTHTGGYYTLVLGAMALFALALWHLIRPRLGPRETVHFLLPGILVAWLIVVEQGGATHLPTSGRVKALTRLLIPFGLGTMLPLAVFLIPLVSAGAAGAFWTALSEKSLRRLVYAAMPPKPLLAMIPSLSLALAAFWPGSRPRALSVVLPWVIGLLLAFLVIRASDWFEYRLAWFAVYCAPPIVVGLGVWLLRRQSGRSLPRAQRQQATVVLTALALFTLIQFPFSAPVYFCYVAPLLILATAVVGKLLGGFVKGAGVPLTAFALVFPIVRVAPAFISKMGLQSGPDEQRARLNIPRGGGLRVTTAEAAEYSKLVSVVQEHSPQSSSILAFPDSPEVYFLTQRRNPTPFFFDFFDPSYPDPERALEIIRTRRISLLVLNARPAFSARLDQRVLDEAASAYPHAASVGRFTVRWQ